MEAEAAEIAAVVEDRRLYGYGEDAIERPVLFVGAESEMFAIRADGRPANVADQVINDMWARGTRWVEPEFPNFAIESVTGILRADPRMFHKLFRQVYGRAEAVREAVEAVPADDEGAPARLLSCGYLPTFPEDELSTVEDHVSPVLPRYAAFVESLRRRNGAYYFTLGDRLVHVPCSPLPGGLAAGFSPNVQFHPDDVGLAADIAVATAFAFVIVGTTSPFAFERFAETDSRVRCWAHGMDPTLGLAPFGTGRYFDVRGAEVILDWLAYVRRQEVVLSLDDVGKHTGAMPAPLHAWIGGTHWPQTVRVRVGTYGGHDEHRGKLAVYLEHRVADTALTRLDDIANFAFFVGVTLGLLAQVESARALISYREAERAFRFCARHGTCHLEWRGRRVDARRLVLETLLPTAQAGLRRAHVADRTISDLLGLVERRLDRGNQPGQTGGDWMRRTAEAFMNERGLDEADAIRATVAALAERQRTQPTRLAGTGGVADWPVEASD